MKKCSLRVFYMMEVSAVRLESVLSMLLSESQSCDSEAIWRKSPGAKLWSRCVREKLTVTNAAVQRFALLLDRSRTLFHSVHPYCRSLKEIVHQKNTVSMFTHPLVLPNPLTFLLLWMRNLEDCVQVTEAPWTSSNTLYFPSYHYTKITHAHFQTSHIKKNLIALDLTASEHLAYNIWTIAVMFLRQFNELNCPWVLCAIRNWTENNSNSRILIEVAKDVREINLN